jgi:hypothetical protein
MRQWDPLGVQRNYKSGPPAVGDVVAWDHCAYLVTHVAPSELRDDEPAERVYYDPYMMTIQRIHGPAHEHENDMQERALRIPPNAYHAWQKYDEGRVPLCSCCGHPWPCRVATAKVISALQAEVLNKKMDRSVPGVCYSCGEVITNRQGSVTYPEPNVELLGYPAPRFHTRNACAEGQYHYEQKRSKALPDVAPVYGASPTGQRLGF